MGIVKQTGRKSSRKSLKSSASLLGLAAGAVGWSGLAQATSEETGSQMMLLPEHYELMDNGVVVFKLETGENLSLTSDQYLILEDGLLLITDELAQASIYSLPVMGSVRAQLLTDLEQVATIDGTVAEATPAQTLSITEGQAPRLSEQVELQSYEVAQTQEAGGDTAETIAMGLSGGAGFMLAAGFMLRDQQDTGEFWTDADIADSASTSITGTNLDSFVGYTAASTGAVADPISNFAAGGSANGTIDLSAGGNNYVNLGSHVARSGGSATYIGADATDVVTLTSDNVKWGADFTLQMGNGSNSFSAGTDVAYSGSDIRYTGGDDADTITFGDGSLYNGGSHTFTMGDGANSLTIGNNSLYSSQDLTYTGGNNEDSIRIGNDSLKFGGALSADMGDGTNELILGSTVAYSASTPVRYEGGDGSDTITVGDKAFYNGGDATFTMGNGTNSLTIGDNAAWSSGDINYVGGVDSDTITIGGNSFYYGGGESGTFAMGNGSNSLNVGATAAFSGGVIDYDGGSGVDALSFGDNLATADSGTVEIDLGAGDTAADVVTFAGAVGTGLGSTVTIQKFNFNDDRIDVEAGIAATVSEIVDGGGNLTWTDSGGNHKLVFAGIGTGGTGVTATSAELAAAII